MTLHLRVSGWTSTEVTEDAGLASITMADGVGQIVDITVNAPGGIAVDLGCASTSSSAPPVPTGLAITSSTSPAPSEGA